MTPAEQASLLDRASPGYRAAVRGGRELPAVQKRGAVRFAAHGVSEYVEDGRRILRARIDEDRVVELALPVGVTCFLKQGGGA